MSKLSALVLAVLVAALAIVAIDSGGSSHHVANITASYYPPYQKWHEEANQWAYKLTPPGSDTVTADTKAVTFVTSKKGVRLKVDPGTEIVEATINYTRWIEPGHDYPKWDGKGVLPFTKVARVNGKLRRIRIHEIKVLAYDPRFPENESHAWGAS